MLTWQTSDQTRVYRLHNFDIDMNINIQFFQRFPATIKLICQQQFPTELSIPI